MVLLPPTAMVSASRAVLRSTLLVEVPSPVTPVASAFTFSRFSTSTVALPPTSRSSVLRPSAVLRCESASLVPSVEDAAAEISASIPDSSEASALTSRESATRP